MKSEMTTNEVKLLPAPCPFCQTKNPGSKLKHGLFRIFCHNCGALGPLREIEESIKAWNRRVTPKAQWMPISEAPRDGRSLFLTNGLEIRKGHWSEVWIEDGKARAWGTIYPTHFLPIPPLPQEEAKEAHTPTPRDQEKEWPCDHIYRSGNEWKWEGLSNAYVAEGVNKCNKCGAVRPSDSNPNKDVSEGAASTFPTEEAADEAFEKWWSENTGKHEGFGFRGCWLDCYDWIRSRMAEGRKG